MNIQFFFWCLFYYSGRLISLTAQCSLNNNCYLCDHIRFKNRYTIVFSQRTQIINEKEDVDGTSNSLEIIALFTVTLYIYAKDFVLYILAIRWKTTTQL